MFIQQSQPVDVDGFMTTYCSLASQNGISYEALNKMGKVAKGLEFATNGVHLFKRMNIKERHDVDRKFAPLWLC